MLKGLTAFFVLVSGLCAMSVEKFGQGLCQFEYMAPDTHSKLRDIYTTYSIVHCSNYSAMGWVACQLLAILFSSAYVVRSGSLFEKK